MIFVVGKLPKEQIIIHSCIFNTFFFSSVGFFSKTIFTPMNLNLLS